MEASQHAIHQLKDKEAAAKRREEQKKADAQETANRIADKTVKMTAKAGQGGRLFGSVTAKEIAEACKNAKNVLCVEMSMGQMVDDV